MDQVSKEFLLRNPNIFIGAAEGGRDAASLSNAVNTASDDCGNIIAALRKDLLLHGIDTDTSEFIQTLLIDPDVRDALDIRDGFRKFD